MDAPEFLVPSFRFDSKIRATAIYQGYTGLRKNVRNVYANVSYRFSDRSSLSMSLQSDKKGLYISQNRLYLGYQVSVPLSSDLTAGFGANLGVFNDVISDNPSGFNNSESVFDGNLGFHLKMKQYVFGVALHQFPNAEVSPLREETYLSPYLNCFIGGESELVSDFGVKYSAFYQLHEELYNRYGINFVMDYQKKAGFGFNYGNLNGLELLLRAKNLALNNGFVSAGMNLGLFRVNALSSTGKVSVFIRFHLQKEGLGYGVKDNE